MDSKKLVSCILSILMVVTLVLFPRQQVNAEFCMEVDKGWIVNLQDYYNGDGFGFNTEKQGGDFDKHNYTYPAEQLNINLKYDEINYKFADMKQSTNNIIICDNQVIDFDAGNNNKICILAAATEGNDSNCSVVLNYEDGSKESKNILIRNWCRDDGNQKVVQKFDYRYKYDGSSCKKENTKTYIYAYYIDSNSNKKLKNITLPKNADIKIMAMTLLYDKHEEPVKKLSRANRIFIDKGLHLGIWVGAQGGEYIIKPQDMIDLGFTSPMFYNGDLCDEQLLDQVPDLTWSVTFNHDPRFLNRKPNKGEYLLDDTQKQYNDRLFSVCLEDEHGYSNNLVNNLKEWYEVSKEQNPETLCFVNQWQGQWSDSQLNEYMRIAKPDLLVYDNYYWSFKGDPDYKIRNSIFSGLKMYRDAAMRGCDGTGKSPIAFGQYLLGYIMGDHVHQTPREDMSNAYFMTESQLNLVGFSTWAFGGKWATIFRWFDDSTHISLFYDQEGNRRPQFDYYAEFARQSKNLSPHLTRITNTDVRFIPGQHKNSSNKIVNNSVPSRMSAWDSNASPYINNINAENIGGACESMKGDVVVGLFEPLPEIDDNFFESDNVEYFMILNGLTDGNATPKEQQNGSGEATRQKITVEFNLNNLNQNCIKRVSRDTGEVEDIELERIDNELYKMDITLDGGVGDLFIIDKNEIK